MVLVPHEEKASSGLKIISVGMAVKIKDGIKPLFGYGGVPYDSQGTVVAQESFTEHALSIRVLLVFFPEHFRWAGLEQELVPVDERTLVRPGENVRLRENVRRPRYNWGRVTKDSVGVVKELQCGGVVIVDFPQQSGWKGLNCELETCQGKLCDECACADDNWPETTSGERATRPGEGEHIRKGVQQQFFHGGMAAKDSVGEVRRICSHDLSGRCGRCELPKSTPTSFKPLEADLKRCKDSSSRRLLGYLCSLVDRVTNPAGGTTSPRIKGRPGTSANTAAELQPLIDFEV